MTLEGVDVANVALGLYPEQAHFDLAVWAENKRLNLGQVVHGLPSLPEKSKAAMSFAQLLAVSIFSTPFGAAQVR